MFEIEIKRTFSAAHALKNYDGPCVNLHGHNYAVHAVLRAKTLDRNGIAVDFVRLKRAVDALIAEFDHTNLSDNPRFADVNPTSEVLAMVIYNELKKEFRDDNVKIHRVSIGESDSSLASYFEE